MCSSKAREKRKKQERKEKKKEEQARKEAERLAEDEQQQLREETAPHKNQAQKNQTGPSRMSGCCCW